LGRDLCIHLVQLNMYSYTEKGLFMKSQKGIS
jgi:hypothetical protein